MTDFLEVADRVWVARQPWLDLNITLVGGADGLLMVDTHGSAAAAREVVADVRRLAAGAVTTVVNTHCHFDHTYGNAAVRAAYGPVPIHAHETVPDDLQEQAERIRRTYVADPTDPRAAEVLATLDTGLTVPDQTFASARMLDLGDRLVEVFHPGRGHSRGDVVLRVPDVDVLVAGDLVEESAAPAYGVDSWPLEWPLTLDSVLGITGAGSVVVPGHGAVVDRDFVEEQRAHLGIVAETIRDLATRGVPVSQALEAAEWPFPVEGLREAVRLGYEHLPRSQKRLPLV